MIAETASPPLPPSAASSGFRRHLRPGAVVFIGAFLLRLFVLFRSADTPHFLPNQGDMKFYSDWALRIAGGHWTDHQAFYGLPGYAYLLAGLYSLIGFQPYIALLLQVLAEAFTTLLIFRIAPLAFGRDGEPAATAGSESASNAREQSAFDSRLIGGAAALGWALFVPAQAYSTILMPTTYFVTAFWFVVWWTLRTRTAPPRPREFLVLGLFMGCVAMMVANILFLSGFVLAALFFRRSWVAALPATGAARWRARAVAAVLLFGGIFAGASPCWLHNYFVAGEPVLLSAHSGLNFWIGNNPEATGYPKVPGGMRADQEGLLKDSITFAEKQVGRPLRHYEVSAFWSQKANRYISGHPGEFARLLGVKLGNFWRAFRYDDLGVILPMQEDSVLLPGPGFGLVAALGLPGLFLAVARRARARWVAAAVLLHMASLLTVFITERYRMAAVPGLLLLGAFGLVELYRLASAHRWAPVAAYGALAAGAVFCVAQPPGDPGLLYLDDYNTGVANLENHDYQRAQPKLERVYAHNPGNPEASFALGNLFLALEHRDKAIWFYQQTLALDGQHYRAMNNLGVLAMEDHRWALAERLFLEAQMRAPNDAKISYLLARTRLAQNNVEGARQAIGEALSVEPGRPAFLALRDELDHPRAAAQP